MISISVASPFSVGSPRGHGNRARRSLFFFFGAVLWRNMVQMLCYEVFISVHSLCWCCFLKERNSKLILQLICFFLVVYPQDFPGFTDQAGPGFSYLSGGLCYLIARRTTNNNSRYICTNILYLALYRCTKC